MALSAIHDKIEDIPENYRDLYTEKSGKFELTGIAGIKTTEDVRRVQVGLDKERLDHKTTKESLGVWQKLGEDSEAVQTVLDRIPELELASKGKLDEQEIETIVTGRVESTIRSQLAPVERELNTAKDTIIALTGERDGLQGEKTQRVIHDDIRKHLIAEKIQPEFHEDALMHADRLFEVREDDQQVITKDGVGVTPGLSGDLWLQEFRPKRPGWWPASEGGGSPGSETPGGQGGENPYSNKHWNMTKQGAYFKEHGSEKAASLAKLAGTTVGGPKPPEKT